MAVDRYLDRKLESFDKINIDNEEDNDTDFLESSSGYVDFSESRLKDTDESEYTTDDTSSRSTRADSRAKVHAAAVFALPAVDSETQSLDIYAGRDVSGVQELTTEERLHRLEQKYEKLEAENRLLCARLQARAVEQGAERAV